MRPLLTLIHRYAGLAMALFLVVAGLTGSLLVWNEELDRAVWPVLRRVAPPTPDAKPLDVFDLRARVLARIPGADTDRLEFANLQRSPGLPVRFGLKPGTAGTAGDDELYVDPYTGKELGRRHWGDILQGSKNLMPFLYRLHDSLALDGIGSVALGIVALVWTLDCVVGFCLTFPRGRPFWRKWQPAWLIQRKRLNHDVHRAGGLWLWPMLFVFAWSGVGFNLRSVYAPVTRALFDYRDDWADVADRARPQVEPGLSFPQAHRIAQTLAAQEGARLGIALRREDWLAYTADKGIYRYGLTSDRDIRESGGATQIWFDADTGALIRTILPTGQHSGNTVSTWLYSLHMAQVWGLPFRIVVCVVGLAVATLTGTGLVIWWRKRKARSRAPDRPPSSVQTHRSAIDVR